MTGGVSDSKSSQRTEKACSNIKHRTFTKSRKSILENISKIKLKIARKSLILGGILPSFAVTLRSFLRRIRLALLSCNPRIKLKNSASGYVLILVITLIPVLLFGAKYVLDQMSVNKAKIEKGTGRYYKKCAREAALAVAKNWNPGLTLAQQKEAVQKIADQVYNNNPCYNDSIVGQAVSGLDVKKSYSVEQGGSKFEPLKVTYESVVPEKKITYVQKDQYKNRIWFRSSYGQNNWNPNYVLWRATDINSDAEYRHSVYDEINPEELAKGNYVLDHHKIYDMPSMRYSGHICKTVDGIYYPNNTKYAPTCHEWHEAFMITVLSPSGGYNIENYPVIRAG